MKKVTLDDVARVAGVSRATASRALNGRSGVRDDVRERVVGTADHLGFRANRAARNLASGRSSLVGLIIPMRDLRVEPFGAVVIQAMGNATAERDLGLILHLTGDETGTTVRNIIRDGLLDGVMIGTSAIGTWADELFDSGLPTVLIGTHPTRTDVAWVDVDNADASERITRHLIEQGCERLGCITGRLDRAASHERLAGFRRALAAAGREVDESLIECGDYGRGSGVEAARRLLPRNVDGIVVGNDEMALGAIWAARRHGLDVPGDLLVAGFDGVVDFEYHEPTLTTIAQPFDAMAHAALDLLDDLASGGSPRSVTLGSELVVGETTLRGSG